MKRIKKHNIVIWIISFVIAVALWVFVSIVLDPVKERTIEGIALEFTDEQYLDSRNLILVDGRNQTVSATFTGRFMELQKLDSKEMKAVVSLSAVRAWGHLSLSYELIGAPDLGTSPRMEPATVTVEIDRVVERDIPIRLDFKAGLAEGYMRKQEALFEPSVIRVRGAQQVMETISEAVVTYESATPLDNSIDTVMSFTFYTNTGEPADPVAVSYLSYEPEVHMTVPITFTKTVPVELTFVDGGGITFEKNITCTYSQNTIQISGDTELLNGIQKIDLGTVDLAALQGDEQIPCPVRIPEGVTNETGVSEITADIKIVGVSTRMITVGADRITATGIPPDGYEINIITQSVDIQIRGVPESVNLITPSNIRVVLELTEGQITGGLQSGIAKVYIDGYPDVGVVMKYSVTVDVAPIKNTVT